MESIFSNNTDEKLDLNEIAVNYLKETAKWGKFLAIVQFVGIALVVLIAFIIGIFLPEMNSAFSQASALPPGLGGGFIMAMYLILAVIMFFPALYLYNYSIKLKSAIEEKNSEVLMEAFKNQKSLYKFFGIFTIVMIAFYAIIFVGAAIGGAIAGL